MNQPRYLTPEEAGLIQQAAEHWLRLREVKFTAGEEAAALLASAHLRPRDCTRDDIAALGRTLLLAVHGEPEAIPIQLVHPRDEDLWTNRVSVLSDLGLACIGQVQGSTIRLSHGHARLVGFGPEEAVPAAGWQEARIAPSINVDPRTRGTLS